MAIEEMELLNITFAKKDLKAVLCQLKRTKDFYPQPASKIVNNVKGVFTLTPDEEYKKMLESLTSMAEVMHLDLKKDVEPNETLDLDKTKATMTSLEEDVKKITDIKDQLVLERDENKAAYELLNGLSATNIDLDELKECQYITARIGRIKRRNQDKLDYYHGQPFIYLKLGEDAKHIYCVYVTTNAAILQIDNIFQSMGFEEVEVPDFVHGTIEKAKSELQEEITAMDQYIEKMDDKLKALKDLHKEEMRHLYADLNLACKIEEFKVFIVDYQSKYAIYGFVPQRECKEIEKSFESFHPEYQELPAHIFDDQNIIAPTVTHNYFWAKPFELISKVKQSDHVDTTLPTAMLYILVFALLLGDLGAGAILVVLGALMHKKPMGKLLAILGCATLVGGFLYGDVFYTTSIYTTLIPQGNVMHRFINAVLLLIVGGFSISTVKSIYNEKSMINKVLSIKGVVGIVMVFAIAAYVAISVDTRIQVSYLPLILVLVVCVILIFVKKAVHKKNV